MFESDLGSDGDGFSNLMDFTSDDDSDGPGIVNSEDEGEIYSNEEKGYAKRVDR